MLEAQVVMHIMILEKLQEYKYQSSPTFTPL